MLAAGGFGICQLGKCGMLSFFVIIERDNNRVCSSSISSGSQTQGFWFVALRACRAVSELPSMRALGLPALLTGSESETDALAHSFPFCGSP